MQKLNTRAPYIHAKYARLIATRSVKDMDEIMQKLNTRAPYIHAKYARLIATRSVKDMDEIMQKLYYVTNFEWMV